MNEKGSSLIGGFAIFTKAPWYIRFLPFIKHSLHNGHNIYVILENFVVDSEWLGILRKANIRVRIFRPRKPYNPFEVRKLATVLLEQYEVISQQGLHAKEFALIANMVRPNTFKRSDKNIKDLCNNKYYIKVI
jgi:hypothetical protein